MHCIIILQVSNIIFVISSIKVTFYSFTVIKLCVFDVELGNQFSGGTRILRELGLIICIFNIWESYGAQNKFSTIFITSNSRFGKKIY